MLKTLIFIGALLFSVVGIAADESDMSPEAVKARLKPIGEVSLKGVQPAVAVAPVAPKPTPAAATAIAQKSGKEIYEGKCVVCHGSGVAGAPKFTNAADWNPRIAAEGTGETAINGLLKIALQGKGAMPPKGTCAECSDQELKAAIKYMLPK